MDIFIGIVEQGLTYAYLAVGLYFAYIILDFPDLTVDGSFPLGGAITAAAILAGLNPFAALLLSMAGGAVAGLLTGLIHVKLGIKDLLAGLIMQTALYTVNLTIAQQASVVLFNQQTIYSNGLIDSLFGGGLAPYRVLLVTLPLVIILKLIIDAFLKTKRGFLLRATGDNPLLVQTMGKDPGMSKILGLSISNALVAFSGGLVVQESRVFNITMGTGAMVMGLASLVIGLKLLGKLTGVKDTTKVIVGSIVYKASIALAIAIGLSANSLKLVTALIFLVILFSGNSRKLRRRMKDA